VNGIFLLNNVFFFEVWMLNWTSTATLFSLLKIGISGTISPKVMHGTGLFIINDCCPRRRKK
jgi:hypothetical protein